ncbi:MAG: LTA synthase family protein [Verrucomicrobiota bacterium]
MTSESVPTSVFTLRLRAATFQLAVFVVFSGILRAILQWKFGQNLTLTGGDLIRIYGTGMWLDLLVGLFVLSPIIFAALKIKDATLQKRWLVWPGRILMAAWWGLILFIIQSEYYFFHEYASRFNTVAIDYLHYWTEVSNNIKQMYPVGPIVTLCTILSLGVCFVSIKYFPLQPGARPGARTRGFLSWIALIVLGVAGTTQMPVQWSSERLVNELSGNGLVSGAIALWTRHLSYGDFFITLDKEEAYKRARTLLDTPNAEWSADPFSIQRRIPGDTSKPKRNVVILLEESFGSEFWGALNGRKGAPESITPRLDKLVDEGLLFTNLFADGNRTIRGIEGVVASFPPLPGDSIVARTLSENCETLATVLGRDGYHTRFIYPGRGVFDGLGRFSLANGFQNFTEQKNFTSPVFTNVWGHCNEDLYDRVLTEAKEDHAAGKPFFITALSVSNHQPFTYPDGRIPEPSYRKNRLYAVKYVDYSIGRFFDMAKKEPFWKDTIFVVIADHGARVYGSETLPIRSYQIPFLVFADGIQPGTQSDVLGCQLDVAPTILSIVGRPYDSLFFGRDLLSPVPAPRRAMLNHNRSVGIYRDNRLVALSLNKVVEQFKGDPKGKLERIPVDEEAQEIANEATALLQVADDLYMHRNYRWKPQPPAKP